MEHLRTDSLVARHISERLADEGLTLLDVGCGGGIDAGWRAFGGRLKAVGIDPGLNEIARLSAAETNAEVRYFAGFAGLPEGHPLRELSDKVSHIRRSPWDNLSASARADFEACRSPTIPAPIQDVLHWEGREADLLQDLDARLAAFESHYTNCGLAAVADTRVLVDSNIEQRLMEESRWLEMTLAPQSNVIVISDLLQDLEIDNLDFVKIDTDGSDYDILYSLSSLLSPLRVLGAVLEVNFSGSHTNHHHAFHNTDRFMKRNGFELYGLGIRQYSASSLPMRFKLPYPAQTEGGRPLLGDALYMRNFGLKSADWNPDNFGDEKVAKLVALFSLFGLPDQGAELILRFRSRLRRIFDPDEVLDLLALEVQAGRDEPRSYAEYMREFGAGDPWFFPHRG